MLRKKRILYRINKFYIKRYPAKKFADFYRDLLMLDKKEV